MYILGLTGPLSSGKSTVSKIFQREDIPVIDADEIVYECYKPNTPVHTALVEKYGDTIINDDKSINRKALVEIIKQNPDELKFIESIVHPQVRLVMKTQLSHAYSKTRNMAVLAVPLMFDNNFNELCDMVATCSCMDETRHHRFLEREGATEEKWKMITSKQLSNDEYIERSDFVINTDESIIQTEHYILGLIEKLSGESGHVWHDKWKKI